MTDKAGNKEKMEKKVGRFVNSECFHTMQMPYTVYSTRLSTGSVLCHAKHECFLLRQILSY